MAEEKVYTINLYNEWKKVQPWKRAKKSITAIKKFIAKNMKVKDKDVKINTWLNAEIWKNSIKNPPRSIKVKAVKDEKGAKVEVELFEKPKRLLKLELKEKARVKKEAGKETKKEEKKEEAKEGIEEKKAEKTEEKEEKKKEREAKEKNKK